MGLPDGRAVASACRRGLARLLWWLPASAGCTARDWGATRRGLGVLEVGGVFVQYAQPLVSGSRPSWNRTTRAHSGQLWAGRRRTMTTGTLRRWWAGVGGGGPVTEAPGSAARTPDSLLRGPVSHQTSSLRPRPHLQDHQPAQGSRPSECLRSHDTHMSQK